MNNNLQSTTQAPSADDPHRPRFHFLPAKNWMNDPNGLIEWRGQYHLFYQHNPYGAAHANMHWGHAVSDDLVGWTELPVALVPQPGGPDAGGCWSGCAVDNHGVPTFVYTGVNPQTVCLATPSPTSSDDLLAWQQHPANPVIAGPPAELAGPSRGDFRDPYVWRSGEQWHMVIGSKTDEGGVVLRYRSDDLVTWEYLGVLLRGEARQSEPYSTGAMWECPNFFPLDGQHMLVLSAQSDRGELLYPVYYAGMFDGEQLTPAAQGILVHGSSFYAPQVLRLADGRTVMWGWLKEGRPVEAALAAGWSGVMSLPIELTWLPEGRVGLRPVEELRALRGQHWHLENIEVGLAVAGLLSGVQGDCLEIEAVLVPGAGAVFAIELRRTEAGAAQARLVYDEALGRLSVEPGPTAPSTVASPERYAAPLRPDADGLVRLHIFLDCSVVEVFANDHTCLAARVYPADAAGLGVELVCEAGTVRVLSLNIWTLAAA